MKKQPWSDIVRSGMAKQGISQYALADKIGRSQGAVALWLTGKREPNIDTIGQLLGGVGIDKVVLNSDGSVSPLMQLDNEQFEYAGILREGTVPVVGELVMEKDGTLSLEKLNIGFLNVESQDPEAHSLRFKGSAAAPRVKSGDFLLIEPNAKLFNGDDVLVVLNNGEYLMRSFDYIRDDEYRFSSINGNENAINIPVSDVKAIYLISGTFHRSRFVSKEDTNQTALE